MPESLFLSIRGVPLRLWVTGSRRRRASKATGIDRTPHSLVGSALGFQDESLNFRATLGVKDPWEMPSGGYPSAGSCRAWFCLLAASGDIKPLEKEVGCPGQGL